jgi:hypothetical protein
MTAAKKTDMVFLDQRDECLQTGPTELLDNPELGHVPTQGIRQHRLLTNQKIACPMQHEHALLRGALEWHKSHARSQYNLADRRGIRGIILLALHERFYPAFTG